MSFCLAYDIIFFDAIEIAPPPIRFAETFDVFDVMINAFQDIENQSHILMNSGWIFI